MATQEAPPRLNKYQRFERAVAGVSEEWDDDVPLYSEPGSRRIYLELEQTVLQKALLAMDNPPVEWLRGAFESVDKWGRTSNAPAIGLRVMALHIYNSACAAGYREVPILIEELAFALRNPSSFEPLKGLTTLRDKEANDLEGSQGLTYYASPPGDLYFARYGYYDFEGGQITMPRLASDVTSPTESTNCHAYKVLAELYQHLVDISLKDSRFTVSSLARATAAFRESKAAASNASVTPVARSLAVSIPS